MAEEYTPVPINSVAELRQVLKDANDGIDIARHIIVCRDKDGGKSYFGERPAMMPDDDNWNDGEEKKKWDKMTEGQRRWWRSKHHLVEPSMSFTIKATKDIYVIDFDDMSLCNDDNDLFTDLMGSDTYRTITRKGWHFYIRVPDMIDFSTGLKVQGGEDKDKLGDVDIIGNRSPASANIVERMEAEVQGGSLCEFEWADLKQYFDEERMMKSKKPVKKSVREHRQDLSNSAIAEGDIISSASIKTYLDRLNKETRFDYDSWFKVGCCCHNSIADKDEGFLLWYNWTKTDPKINVPRNDGGHDHRTMEFCREHWGRMRTEREIVATWTSLRVMANKDDPKNEFQELFETGGEDAVVKFMNTFLAFNRNTGEIIFFDPLDDTSFKEVRMCSDQHMTKTYKRNGIWIEGKKKPLNPFTLWESHKDQRQVARVVFDPHPRSKDQNVFNLFQGFDYNACTVAHIDSGMAETGCRNLLDHIYNIWASGDSVLYEYILNWFAYILQYPWKKIGVLLVVKSKQGAGKGIVFNFMEQILGRNLYSQISSIKLLLGDFNKTLEGRLLINLDEAHWGGNTSEGNRLKNLITEVWQPINEKNKEVRNIMNTTAFSASSNEERATSATEGDRRHCGMELANTWAGRQETPEHTKYFCDITGSSPGMPIEEHRVECFAKVLYDRDLSNFVPQKMPRTEYIAEQIERNWTPVQKWWSEVLEMGHFSIKNPQEFVKKYSKKKAFDDPRPYDTSILQWGAIQTGRNGIYSTKTEEYAGNHIRFYASLPCVKTYDPMDDIECMDGDNACSWWFPDASHRSCEEWCYGTMSARFPCRNPVWSLWFNALNNLKDKIPPKYHFDFSNKKEDESEVVMRRRWQSVLLPVPKWFYERHKTTYDYGCANDKKFVSVGRMKLYNKPRDAEYDNDGGLSHKELPTNAHWQNGLQWRPWQKLYDDSMLCPKMISRLLVECPEFLDSNDDITNMGQMLEYFNTFSYDRVCDAFETKEGVSALRERLVSNHMLGDHSEPLTELCKKQVVEVAGYDKDFLFDCFSHTKGAGYGANGVDKDAFFKMIKEMMNGDTYDAVKRPLAKGQYRNISHQLNGVRRKYLVAPSLQQLRAEFSKWAGRFINWDDCDEITLEEDKDSLRHQEYILGVGRAGAGDVIGDSSDDE